MAAPLRITVDGVPALLNTDYVAGVLPDANNPDRVNIYCADPIGVVTVDETVDEVKSRWTALFEETRPWAKD